MHVIRLGAAVALAGALLIPSAAPAATKTVYMGTPPSAGNALRKLNVDANNFFPLKTTVRVGDKVSFVPVGFHNLNRPARGKGATPLLTPTGATAAVTDAAGVAFWFNGQPAIGFNPALMKMSFGKTFTVPTAKGFNSGLPLGDKLKPVTVRFTKPGSYTFLCDIHPGMKARVVTVGRRGRVPSAKADATTVASQIRGAKADAAKLAKANVPANTVIMGPERSGTALYEFAPRTLTVAPGTTVDFKMPANAREVHTATFGPGDAEKEPTSYLGKIAASFESPVFDPQGTYPSEAPGTMATLNPSLHGNGFWNSGLLDGSSAVPLPSSGKVRFDTPGSYDYYCMIHTFMKGTVKVG